LGFSSNQLLINIDCNMAHKLVSAGNNALQTKQLQLLLDGAQGSEGQTAPTTERSQRPMGEESRRIAPGRVRPQTGKRSNSSFAAPHEKDCSVVSSIIGNMYTPFTTARTRSRGPTERGMTARSRVSQRTRQSRMSGSMLSYGSQASRQSQSSQGSGRPTTAEVLLAKKQLKMEGMIRKLLVQQQEADCTIAELSQALNRLDPAEKEHIDLHEMAAAVRESKNGKKFGVQHLNGAPLDGSLKHKSPWHIAKTDISQDIACAIHPDGIHTGRSSRSGTKTAHLDGRGVKSLVAPGNLFVSNGVTMSPNNNPGDILKYQDSKDKYCAPPVPKHLDSRRLADSIYKWGSDEQADAWDKSTARWQTHTEDIHGYTKFGQGVLNRPSSAVSRVSQGRSDHRNRPMSAMSSKHRGKQHVAEG